MKYIFYFILILYLNTTGCPQLRQYATSEVHHKHGKIIFQWQ